MRARILPTALSAAVLLGCEVQTEREPVEQVPAATAPDTAAVVSAARDTALEVFVEQPPADARLVFVGQDSTIRPDRPDALFVPFSTFSVERDGIPNEFPPADSLATMLESAGIRGERMVFVGEPIPAARAWTAFDYLGLADRAALLDGGPAALAAAPAAAPTADTGRARAVDSGAPARLDLDPREDMIVDAEWVHERLVDPNVVIIDARPPEEFSGETPGDGIDRPGHIPGARNLFWQTLVESPDRPRLKDEAELRRMFEEVGAGPGRTLVVYCRTGGQSSFLYAVARQFGYDVRLYDGSFVDWARTEYPVQR